jgi:hypothetical protein
VTTVKISYQRCDSASKFRLDNTNDSSGYIGVIHLASVETVDLVETSVSNS